VRVGAAGKVMGGERVAELLDEGCDFVLIGRGAILQPDFPEQVRRDPASTARAAPVSAEFLRANGLSEPFIHYMATAWNNFVFRDEAA
jgi:2,4-dienoyl-CoA reductase-like NADH-dependent reductase (Old Yellow Enzyme family)